TDSISWTSSDPMLSSAHRCSTNFWERYRTLFSSYCSSNKRISDTESSAQVRLTVEPSTYDPALARKLCGSSVGQLPATYAMSSARADLPDPFCPTTETRPGFSGIVMSSNH